MSVPARAPLVPSPPPAARPPQAHPGPPSAPLLTDPECPGDEPESQDAETERFLAGSTVGRRVSFNEAALFEQSRKGQDKGRR